MRKTRSLLLAGAGAVAALVLAVPFTASATPAASASVVAVGADGAVAVAPVASSASDVGVAIETEINQAVAGSPPSGLPCVATTGATACFEADGDKWWVKDTAGDSASAEARWLNYRNGSLYRQGICRNSLGNGEWGVCNKNYYEDSTLVYRACVYDASEGVLVRCS